MRGTDKHIYKLKHTSGTPVSTEDLLNDLRQVSTRTGHSSVTFREYESLGQYSAHSIQKRFGSWNEALKRAELSISKQSNIDVEQLFDNLQRLWILLGRQPVKRDLQTACSEFSAKPYIRVFGSWQKTLETFIDWVNTEGSSPSVLAISDTIINTKSGNDGKTREPNLRTRFTVMKRDGFRCCYCGRSPATHVGVELVIDHVHPWSKGGNTDIDNLVTSCTECNLGKGNISILDR